MVGSVAITYLPNTIGVKYARQYVEASLPYCKSVRAEPETMTLLNQVPFVSCFTLGITGKKCCVMLKQE